MLLIFSIPSVGIISHSRKKWTRYYHKCTQVFLSEFSGQIFEKILKYKMSHFMFKWPYIVTSFVLVVLYEKIKFRINPFCGSEFFFAGGRTDGRLHRQISLRKLIVAFRDFAISLKVLNCVHINTPVFRMILTTTQFIDLSLVELHCSPWRTI